MKKTHRKKSDWVFCRCISSCCTSFSECGRPYFQEQWWLDSRFFLLLLLFVDGDIKRAHRFDWCAPGNYFLVLVGLEDSILFIVEPVWQDNLGLVSRKKNYIWEINEKSVREVYLFRQILWSIGESNPWPLQCECSALPTVPMPQIFPFWRFPVIHPLSGWISRGFGAV